MSFSMEGPMWHITEGASGQQPVMKRGPQSHNPWWAESCQWPGKWDWKQMRLQLNLQMRLEPWPTPWLYLVTVHEPEWAHKQLPVPNSQNLWTQEGILGSLRKNYKLWWQTRTLEDKLVPVSVFHSCQLGHMGGLRDKLAPFKSTWLGICRCRQGNLAGAGGTTDLAARWPAISKSALAPRVAWSCMTSRVEIWLLLISAFQILCGFLLWQSLTQNHIEKGILGNILLLA